MILRTGVTHMYSTKSNLFINKFALAFPATTGIIATQSTGETKYYGISDGFFLNIGLWSQSVQFKSTQGKPITEYNLKQKK